jgi:K+-sensing histidine kinase KdpD
MARMVAGSPEPPDLAGIGSKEATVVILVLALQLVAAVAALWFLYLVFQDSTKWLLIFLLGLPIAYYFLRGVAGPLLATIITVVPTLWYVKERWQLVGNVWLTMVGAGVLSSILSIL